jgi:hypothetical protein
MTQTPASLPPMNDSEWKQLEGQRIMAALGGIAAIPGAGLIYLGAAGAPLFAAALVLVAGAYVCWLFTDNIYHLSVLVRDRGKLRLFLPAMMTLGVPLSLSTILYGAASLLCTIAGFIGAHGSWRVPVSVDVGLVVALGIGLAMLAHLLTVYRTLNRLRDVVRRYSYVYRKRQLDRAA